MLSNCVSNDLKLRFKCALSSGQGFDTAGWRHARPSLQLEERERVCVCAALQGTCYEHCLRSRIYQIKVIITINSEGEGGLDAFWDLYAREEIQHGGGMYRATDMQCLKAHLSTEPGWTVGDVIDVATD